MFHIDKTVIRRKDEEVDCPGLKSVCEICLQHKNVQADDVVSYFGFPTSARTKYLIGSTCGYYRAVVEECIMGMKTGEISEFNVEFFKSDPGKPSLLQFQIEMYEFSPGLELYQIPIAERITVSEQWKNFGNTIFRASNFCMAGYWYSKALRVLLSCEEEEISDKRMHEYKDLICSCYINLAAVQLKRKLYRHAADNCTSALNFNACLIKALFRRAQAYEACNLTDSALRDLIVALKIDPKSGAVRTLFESISMKTKNARGEPKLKP